MGKIKTSENQLPDSLPCKNCSFFGGVVGISERRKGVRCTNGKGSEQGLFFAVDLETDNWWLMSGECKEGKLEK